MLGLCLAFAQPLLRFCLAFAWSLLSICLTFALHLLRSLLDICLAFSGTLQVILHHKKWEKINSPFIFLLLPFCFLLLFWQSLIMMEKEQSKSYVPVRINHAWSKTLWKIFSSNHSSNWKKDISFLHLYSLHVPYIYWSETL